MLQDQVIYVISDEPSKDNYSGFIDEAFLRKHVQDFSKHFYLCGPDPMVAAMQQILAKLGASADAVVFEK